MAKYDYRCDKCNKVFEVERSMTEEVSYATCPDCYNDSKQVILKPRVFDSYFEGSVKEQYPPKSKW